MPLAVLVSHRKRFIYTKTVKTAGTSVEAYFEPFCMPEGTWSLSHLRDAQVCAEGIVGQRGGDVAGLPWRNHMPAAEIRSRVGPAVWDDYFKFCVIRDPFDKLVSGFYFQEGDRPPRRRRRGASRWARLPRRAGGRRDAQDSIDRFRSWVASGGAIVDRDKYLIDGEVCVDYFIRYEDLENGVRSVCERIGVPFRPERIPRLKSGLRDPTIPLAAFYDGATIRIVERLYAFELARFGYRPPDPLGLRPGAGPRGGADQGTV